MPFRRYQVQFEPSGQSIEVDEGSTILDAAHLLEINLDHVCGGACACATCHVFIKKGLEALGEQSEEEKDMLSTATRQKLNSRLACQTEVLTDLIVEIPCGQ